MALAKPGELCECGGVLKKYRDAQGSGLYCLTCTTIWEADPTPVSPVGRRYTPGMVRAQESYDEPLDRVIPKLINLLGFTRAARQLNISHGALTYWCTVLGVRVVKAALAPDEDLEVRKKK